MAFSSPLLKLTPSCILLFAFNNVLSRQTRQTLSVGQSHIHPQLQPLQNIQVCENVSVTLLVSSQAGRNICCVWLNGVVLSFLMFADFETWLKVKSLDWSGVKIVSASRLMSLSDVVLLFVRCFPSGWGGEGVHWWWGWRWRQEEKEEEEEEEIKETVTGEDRQRLISSFFFVKHGQVHLRSTFTFTNQMCQFSFQQETFVIWLATARLQSWHVVLLQC